MLIEHEAELYTITACRFRHQSHMHVGPDAAGVCLTSTPGFSWELSESHGVARNHKHSWPDADLDFSVFFLSKEYACIRNGFQ